MDFSKPFSGFSQLCPAVVNYIERYAPERISKLIPIRSPMMCAAIYAKKYMGIDGSLQSSQLVAKQGFSPFEQYIKSGRIGPWTDVYAMAATIYYCCTGKLPPSAIERMESDTLSCQPLLTKAQFNALAKCMTVSPQKRPQDMDTILKIVVPAPEPKRAAPIKPEPPKRKSSLPKWLISIAAAGIAVLAIGIGMSGRKQPDTAAAKKSTDAQTVPTESATVQTAPTERTMEQTVPPETAPEETKVSGIIDGCTSLKDFKCSDDRILAEYVKVFGKYPPLE